MPTPSRSTRRLARATLGLALMANLAACAPSYEALHRYDASDRMMAEAKAGAHEVGLGVDRQLQDALRKQQAAHEQFQRLVAQAQAQNARERRLHPGRDGGAPPPSLAYQRVMSGVDDQLDAIQRRYDHDRLQAQLDAGEAERQAVTDQGLYEARHLDDGEGYAREGVWPDSCGEYLRRERHVDCAD